MVLDIVVSYKSEITNTNQLLKIIINLFNNKNPLIIASIFLILTVLINTCLRALTQRLQYFNTAKLDRKYQKGIFYYVIQTIYLACRE